MVKNSKSSPVTHVLLCGLRGCGKTLLLYKTIIPDWNTANSEIQPTPLYHYEELKYNGKTLGIWDFSGDIVILAKNTSLHLTYLSYQQFRYYFKDVRNMPNFVSRQVEVGAIVFIVNTLDMNESKNNEVINWLSSLESESSLAHSRFAVLFNGSQDLIRGENYENFLKQLEPFSLRLGERFMCRNVNTIMGLGDPGWLVTLDFIISKSSREKKKSNKISKK